MMGIGSWLRFLARLSFHERRDLSARFQRGTFSVPRHRKAGVQKSRGPLNRGPFLVSAGDLFCPEAHKVLHKVSHEARQQLYSLQVPSQTAEANFKPQRP